MPANTVLAQFCRRKVIMSSPMPAGSLQRPNVSTVQPEKRCWEWCGQFDALDGIFGALTCDGKRKQVCVGCRGLLY